MRPSRSLSLVSIVLLAILPVACGDGGGQAPAGGSGAAVDGSGAEPAEADERETAAGDGSEIVERALEAWKENAEGVAGFTVVEETNGTERTRRYVKTMVEGLPVYRPAGAEGGAASVGLMGMLERARYTGTGEVEGTPTEVFVVEGAEAIREAAGDTLPRAFEPTRIEIQVGPDDFPRRATIEGEATAPDGEAHRITTVVTMTDWRTVDGFRHPFRTSTRHEGVADLARAAASRRMAEMESQIEQMPEAQRQQAREMMRQQLESIPEGPQETVTVVKELRVEPE